MFHRSSCVVYFPKPKKSNHNNKDNQFKIIFYVFGQRVQIQIVLLGAAYF